MRPSHSEPERAKPRVFRGRCLGIALLVAFAPAALAGQATTDTTRTITVPKGECCLSLVMPLVVISAVNLTLAALMFRRKAA